MPGRPVATLALAIAWLSVNLSAAPGAGARVVVLDQAARSLTVLALPSGAVTQTVGLQGTPTLLLRTPDGGRFLVLDRGEGRQNGTVFEPATRSAVTILDASTLAIQARVELGWGLDEAPMLSRTGD